MDRALQSITNIQIDMETRPDPKQQQLPDEHDDSSPPAYPRWVLLDKSIRRCEEAPDAKTAAHARISDGRPIRVSFGFAPPPAASRLRADIPGCADDGIATLAIAAHGDSVLFRVLTRKVSREEAGGYTYTSDYFVYSAGLSPSPSLAVIPPFGPVAKYGELYMDKQGTALLRGRGDGELVVALMDSVQAEEDGDEEGAVGADVCVFRPWSGGWKLKRLPVLHDEGKRRELLCWETDAVVPVGDRFLYWVDYGRGIIFSDVRREAPELRYVSLPVKPDLDDDRDCHDQGRDKPRYRRLCATDGGTVRFVEVFPRCCCGCPGATACALSQQAFTIATWTLRTDDMMTWHKDGLVDCDDIWSLAGYDGVLPRVKLMYPMLSLDDGDLDALCFMVKNRDVVWLVEVDTRRMELRSIFRYGNVAKDEEPTFVPSKVSQYFNTIHGGLMPPAKPSLKPTLSKKGPLSTTLPKTPDNLLCDDMRRAYTVLACDEDRLKFRALYLALPEDMRKDYCCLMTKMYSFDI